jgi:hypothetical protein
MNQAEFEPKKALQATRIIYFGIISGSLIFLAAVFYLTNGKLQYSLNLSDPYIIALTLLSITAIPAGYLVSGRSYSRLNPEDGLSRKYEVYQRGLIIRMATCEGITLFSAVCMLLTYNSFMVFFFFFAFLIMLRNYPSPTNIAKELNLSSSETESFYR